MEPKTYIDFKDREYGGKDKFANFDDVDTICLLYTSPSPRDRG